MYELTAFFGQFFSAKRASSANRQPPFLVLKSPIAKTTNPCLLNKKAVYKDFVKLNFYAPI
jgi:hypothetical protein